MSVRYYTKDHPMVLLRTGDPARGEWQPKDKRKPRKQRTAAPKDRRREQ